MLSKVDAGVVAGLLVAIALEVLMPVAAALWARRRLGVAWKVMGFGALAFAVSQLFTRLPLVQVGQFLLRDELKGSVVFQHAWLFLLCVTAGLFEETARWWMFRGPLRDFRRWRDGVGFGVGHGGLESAVLIGGLTVLGLVNVVVLSNLDVSTLQLTPEQAEQVAAAKATFAAMRWWDPLLGAYERVGAMVLHVALSLLVLRGFVRGQRRWYWLAVGLHTLFNLAAAEVMRAWGALAAEGAVTVGALVCLGIILRLRREEDADATSAPGSPGASARS